MTDELSKYRQEAKRLGEERGYALPVYDWLAERDPHFALARMEYLRLIFNPETFELPVKYREMIVAVLLAFRMRPTVKMHLRRALDEGATIQELVEAFEVASVPGGIPTMSFGLEHLIELERERTETDRNSTP